MPSNCRPGVALLIETSNSYVRGLLQGIRRYLSEHPPWALHWFEHGRGEAVLEWLRNWKGDGIIARVENRQIAAAIRATRLPAVDVSSALPIPPFPRVATDLRATARLAFEHLRERGHTQFAYCGDPRFLWSQVRGTHFAEYARSAQCPCYNFLDGEKIRARAERSELEQIAAWVESLPKPIGVMTCYDALGRQVLEACRHVGVAVPDEVSVIGVHNDELLCDLCDPPLSSVIPNAYRAGYDAAALLGRLMSGRTNLPRARANTRSLARSPVAAQVQLIEPIGVATRQSTDVVAVRDTEVAAAIRFIRDHACEQIDVADVLRVVAISRSQLERRFKCSVGYTPHDLIARLRLGRVKQLLTTTELSLTQIAQRAGFSHVEYLSVAFKRATGISPRSYRLRWQVRT